MVRRVVSSDADSATVVVTDLDKGDVVVTAGRLGLTASNAIGKFGWEQRSYVSDRISEKPEFRGVTRWQLLNVVVCS